MALSPSPDIELTFISYRYAAVELGGMSIRVAIAEDTPENIVDRKTFKTKTPAETIPQARVAVSPPPPLATPA